MVVVGADRVSGAAGRRPMVFVVVMGFVSVVVGEGSEREEQSAERQPGKTFHVTPQSMRRNQCHGILVRPQGRVKLGS